MATILESVRPVSPRALTAYYLSALLVVASLIIASHVVLTAVLDNDQGAAAVINISGRQRMLSQRIASLAAQYRLGERTVRPDLVAAIDEFESSERSLAEATLAVKRADPGIRSLEAIYSGGTQPLNAEVRAFVSDARRVANLPPGAPAAAAPLSHLFAASRSALLTKLEAVVAIHQHETERVLAESARLQLALLGVVLSVLAVEALMIFQPMIRRIGAYTKELLRLATIDPLTELANRRGFLERCEIECARALRYARPLSLMMLDLDYFKQVNDTYGHEAGDQVLRALSSALRRTLRRSDLAGRLGGEEFAILLPETDLTGAAVFAERVRAIIANLSVVFEQQNISMTVSIGVTAVRPGPGGIEAALRDSDDSMYRAKRDGRNRISVSPTSV